MNRQPYDQFISRILSLFGLIAFTDDEAILDLFTEIMDSFDAGSLTKSQVYDLRRRIDTLFLRYFREICV